jgi:hypothetical protein
MNQTTRWTIPATALVAEFYTIAERGDLIPAAAHTVCEECGFEYPTDFTARIWYFTRRGNNTTAVAALCGGCDRRMIVEMEAGR